MAQAIVHRSLTKLRSAIGDEKNMMCSKFDGDLREMVGVLEDIEPVLEDAEIRSLWDEASREWLGRVRNAAYGISDMIDDLQDTRRRKMVGISIVPKRNTISNKIKEMKLELRVLQESHGASVTETIGVVQPPSPSPPPSPLFELTSYAPPIYEYTPYTPAFPPPPVYYYYPAPPIPVYYRAPPIPPRPLNRIVWGSAAHRCVDEKNIVGRNENKQRIIATLSANDIREGPTILPVFGLATIGKTTLAAMVFQDTGFGEYRLRIWVDVTPKFDLPNIGHYIISKILEEINLQTEHQRGSHSYHGNQVSEEEIGKGSDGAFQISEDESSEGSDGSFQISEDGSSEGSDEASQLSGDEINEGSDGKSRVLAEEINRVSNETSNVSDSDDDVYSDGASQLSGDEINEGSDGTSRVLAEEINKGSNETSNVSDDDKFSDEASKVSEDEINKGSDGTCRVLTEETNKVTCEISEVLEDQKISSGVDGSSQVSEEEITKIQKCVTQGKGTNETSKASKEEIIQCSNQLSPISGGVRPQAARAVACRYTGCLACGRKKPLPPVTEEESHQVSDAVDRIAKHLHELLNGMKVLIVLDDIWEEDSNELERLKRMLGVGIKGSKVTVIATTCNESIARKVCTVKPYKLDPLINDMCWTIIKQKSDFEDRPESDKQELEQIGLQIASKCGGLPLAAQQLGRSLSGQDAKSWAEAMKGDIWSNMRSNKDVIWSLVLSYRSMSPDLRLCFAYCAIFQQGDNIVKDDIIHQWIALGLVQPADNLSITQVAEEYIRRLQDISFLQTAESAASTSGNGDAGAILLTMHEMAHALARSVGEELIVLDDRLGTSDKKKCCRYALLTDFGVKLSSKLPTQLRALHCVGYSKMNLGKDAFSFTRCLRVLHLNECSMKKLPDSVCQLSQLEYLNLSGCSRLMTLPESFGDLLNLWYINLSRCYDLAELPESFGKLKKLVCLDLSFWCCFQGIPVLGGLTSLEHLNLSHPCCYHAQHRWHLEGLKDVLCKLVNLQYLNLSMCMNPIFCHLSEEKCREYIQSCTSKLSNLQHLDLSHNIFLDDLPESLGELQKLHTLDLTGCSRLKRVAKRIYESDSLKLIVTRNCRGLTSCYFVVHSDDGRFSSNLVQLENVNCQDLGITCLEKVKSREEAQRIRLVDKRNVEELTLGWTVGSQGSVEEDANLLGELKPPHDLQRLKLHGYRATCLPAWMLSISSYLPNLMEVTMEDFLRCRRLPPFAQLPNLQTLVLRRMSNIRRIDAAELSGDNRAAAELNRLSNFTIDDMENLIEFNTTYYSVSGEQVMFRTIDQLEIRKCSKLSFRSLPPRARRLVILDCPQVLSSTRLQVSNCDQVIALQRETAAGDGSGVEGPCTASAPVAELVIRGCIADWSLLRYLAGLKKLSISHCEGMTSLPQDMGILNSLHDLQIVCCKQLKDFPQSMKHLTSLHSLHFAKCHSIRKLPEWLGCLTSLQKLSIQKCRALKSLPRSIKGLDNLNDLDIVKCQRLENWCKENNKKLGRIQPTYSYRTEITPPDSEACSVM